MTPKFGIISSVLSYILIPVTSCLEENILREFVIQINGQVIERESKNDNISTGSIEVLVNSIEILNPSKTPPFTIENNSGLSLIHI